MIRKVIKQGNGTLTLTLPKEWTKEVGLCKNDQIEIILHQNGLTVRPLETKNERSILVDIDKFDRMPLAKFLIACYELGFDTITLEFTKSTILAWNEPEQEISKVISYFVSRLVGFEILSQTKNSVTIGNIAKKHEKFEALMSRIFFLIEENIKNTIDSSKDKKLLKDYTTRHDAVTKLIALCIREINESEDFTKAEAINFGIILDILDKTTDFLRNSSKYALKEKCIMTKENLKMAEMALKFVEEYRSLFSKFDFEKVNLLDDMRGDTKSMFCKSKTSQEIISIAQFDALVETLYSAVKPLIAIYISRTRLNQFSAKNSLQGNLRN